MTRFIFFRNKSILELDRKIKYIGWNYVSRGDFDENMILFFFCFWFISIFEHCRSL